MDIFWLFLLIPHSHCSEVRASEWEGAKQGWLLRNFCCCCCCTTRLVMHAPLLGPAPRGVCVSEMGRDGAHRVVCTAARRWARGLLLIVQLSLLIMSLSNQCKTRQEPKWHFSTLITRVLCGATVLYFHPSAVIVNWISHSAWSYGWIYLGAAHKWETPKRCARAKVQR